MRLSEAIAYSTLYKLCELWVRTCSTYETLLQYKEDVEYKQGTSSSFDKGWHYLKMFVNKSSHLLGYQLKMFSNLWQAAKTN